ncbi:hypothetical protein DIPPA_17926 [Diplonema papillatum]|nr:hypothetical protein DIPPA_17926 [Diplonema papillatum]
MPVARSMVAVLLCMLLSVLFLAHAPRAQTHAESKAAAALTRDGLLRRRGLDSEWGFSSDSDEAMRQFQAALDERMEGDDQPTTPPSQAVGNTILLGPKRPVVIPGLPELPTEPRLRAADITVRQVFPEPEHDERALGYSLPGGVQFTGEMLPSFRDDAGLGWLKQLPPTPDAPSGADALRLARSWGLPDHWNARHHPTHFLLGSPKAGTTFVEKCYSSGAFAGDREHMPYPRPNVRWPVRKDRYGEPVSWHTAFAFENAWNRTGFRRWDLLKEPRAYLGCENYTSPVYYRTFESFPPVEEGSKNWEILDATPTYISNVRAVENVYVDHLHDLTRPRFVVVWREPFARMYSHFVMIVGRKPSVQPHAFVARMRKDYQHLLREPGCRVVIDDPESLMRSENKALLRYVLNKCFVFPKYLSFSLPVLGLRYWLHHFDASQFTVIKTQAMSKPEPEPLIATLEEAFDLKALPKCEDGQNWRTENCAGPGFWSQITSMCSDPKARGHNRAASYSARAKTAAISKGTEEDQAPYLALFAKYEALMQKLIEDFNIRFVDK